MLIIELKCWQFLHRTRRDCADGRQGGGLRGGHVEYVFGGHIRILHGKGACGWLQEVAVRHQAEQGVVRATPAAALQVA